MRLYYMNRSSQFYDCGMTLYKTKKGHSIRHEGYLNDTTT